MDAPNDLWAKYEDRFWLAHVDVTCLPASLHNRPERIPGAMRRKIAESRARYARLLRPPLPFEWGCR